MRSDIVSDIELNICPEGCSDRRAALNRTSLTAAAARGAAAGLFAGLIARLILSLFQAQLPGSADTAVTLSLLLSCLTGAGYLGFTAFLVRFCRLP